ncbi:MAG: hypothetical protein AABY53_01525 [Bdellovibrionota bacterium]
MGKQTLKQLIFISVFLFYSSVFAQAKASAGAMLLFGTGSMGNSTDALSRAMAYTPVILFAGYNIKKFRIGLNYEYNLVGQTADPADFSNQNLGGSGSAMGLRLEFYDGKQAAGLVYRASEKYKLTKPTALGTSADYDGTAGFGFQYYRRIKNKYGIVLDFSSGAMKSSAGNTADIQWNRVALGLVFTNFAK